MNLAVQVFQIIFYSIGSIFMLTFCIIGIWSFILYNKSYTLKRIQNYILEKIYQSLNQNLGESGLHNENTSDLFNDDSINPLNFSDKN